MSSAFSAALHSKWTGEASPRAGPVSCWAAGQNRGYIWLLKQQQQQCWKVRVHCFLLIAEVTKFKMQLEVPGLVGTYTNAADRKLEEGQKVSSRVLLPLILSPLCDCVESDFLFGLIEPASAALGSAETRYRPAVWWKSLLSQHGRREAETGADHCRWDISQTGTNSFKVYLKVTKITQIIIFPFASFVSVTHKEYKYSNIKQLLIILKAMYP